MATREKLYEKFGPRLIEAIVLTMKDEINILRAEANLPERSSQQLVDALSNKLDNTAKYNWMTEDI